MITRRLFTTLLALLPVPLRRPRQLAEPILERMAFTVGDSAGPVFVHQLVTPVLPECVLDGQYTVWARDVTVSGDARLLGIFITSSEKRWPQRFGPFSVAAAFGGVLPPRIELKVTKGEPSL